MLRKHWRLDWVTSDEGWEVQVHRRFVIRYTEGDREVKVRRRRRCDAHRNHPSCLRGPVASTRAARVGYGVRYRMKPHRLPDAAYRGRKSISFTACEANRKPVLAEPEFADSCASNLARAAVENRCIVPIYTIMPDHMHVLIMGIEDSSRPKDAMERFKYLSGTWLFNERPGVAWQDDFCDRMIRS